MASPFTRKDFLVVFSAAALVWMVFHAIVLWLIGFQVNDAAVDSLASNLLLIAACEAVTFALQYYLPKKNRLAYVFAFSAALSLLVLFILQHLFSWLIEKGIYHVTFQSLMLPVRFGVAFLIIGFVAVIVMFWNQLQQQQENEQRKADAEKLAREAELFNLRHQLQPHFLFNSLNSISSLTISRPEDAREMIQQLSDFLRGTLKKEENTLYTLQEELHYLNLYLTIEKVRFGHRLKTNMENDEASLKMKLPPLLLQPLMENAIKFGLYDTTGEVSISLNAKAENEFLVVTIANPFDEQTTAARPGAGFGLKSIQRRLQLLYMRNDLLTTTAENNLFTTTIKIPQA